MMTCREAHKLLSVRREWTVQEQAHVEGHLSGCPACQAVARDYELMDRRLGRLPEPVLVGLGPGAVQARITAKERTVNTQSWAWRRQAIWGATLVAVVALMAIAALAWVNRPPMPVAAPGLGPLAGKATATVQALLDDEEAVEEQVERFVWPAEGCVSQPYSDDHPAVDIANRVGTPVYAVDDGQAAQVNREDSVHGTYVRLEHADGYESFYSHLDEAHVETGENVTRGQEIGLMGDTGKSTGPHLHFEILKDGESLNPFLTLTGEEWTAKLAPVAPSSEHLSGEENGFVWPTGGFITQGYSSRHSALDIANYLGDPVVAASEGAVVEVGQDDRHGIYVRLDHIEGYQTFYSHLDTAHVKEGDAVGKGQEIGSVGETGIATGPHLHFEIQKDGQAVDPLKVLPHMEK